MSKEKSWFARNIVDFSDESKPQEKIAPPNFSPSSPTTYTPPAASVASGANVNAPTSVVVVPNSDIEKFRAHIKDVLRKANQQGPDYFEFSEAIQKNESLNLPKATSFAVAFNSLQALGLTKSRLIETAQTYITELDKELSSFNADIERRRQMEVIGRVNEIKKLEDDNQQKAKQIEQLTNEMNQNNAKRQELTIQKMQEEEKLNTSLKNMEYAISVEKGRIAEDVQLIQTSIQ